MKRVLIFIFLINLFFAHSQEASDDIKNDVTTDNGIIYKENFTDKYKKFTENRNKIKESAPFFDGSSDYIEIKNPFANPKNGSVSLWVSFDSQPTKDAPLKIFYEIVKGKVNNIISGDWGLALFNDFYSGVTFAITDQKTNTGIFLPSNFTPRLKKWYYVVVSWGSGGMKLYIDGVLYAKN
ncbi:MAG TPA: hypothetical protein PK771_08275, partial [Spirochaetota bacterium]|nr:hypothetical protein [Spirochaetota bacterium]